MLCGYFTIFYSLKVCALFSRWCHAAAAAAVTVHFFFHSSIFSFYFTLFNSSCTLPCIQFGITWAKPLTQILASQFNPFRVFISQFSLRCLAFELFFYPRLCSRCIFFLSYFLLCLKSCSISTSFCLSQSLFSSICFSLLLSQILCSSSYFFI